ncbi:hypothetical protein [Gilvimarinus xylanilyticus]|uniref:Uncharacterized protein n=1 Tax=Gilvimarinus xylanilyticus TaxID=2944139 RepID=A0A9X2KTC3_9GAMM|nr:hypothetical protein [Gilvimarinus xylanilyticus]MCP8899771.1 hypothetical protein [Gilvimarinus xylanilyticus]
MKRINGLLAAMAVSLVTGCGGSSSNDDDDTSFSSSSSVQMSSSSSSVESSNSQISSSTSSIGSSSSQVASSASSDGSNSSASSEPNSSSSSVSSAAAAKTGVFLDSPVVNIGYRTETLDGQTNGGGEFQYLEGETVTFFIGNLEFPAVAAVSKITPLDLAGTDDSSNPMVVNIIRLLQSLDVDGNPENGLEIAKTAKTVSVPVDFSAPINDFEANAAVVNLVANSGSVITRLVSQSAAISHFEQTLTAEGIEFTNNSSVVGVWRTSQTENDLLAFVFFADGTYAHVEIDEKGPYEYEDQDSGMEWGTYAVNQETGLVAVSQIFDENGGAGLTSFTDEDRDLFFHVSGDILTLEFDENANGVIDTEGETLVFSRQSASSGLYGPWVNESSENEFLAFVFFEDNTYIHMEVDEEEPFDVYGEDSGMEWGSYNLNSETGALVIDVFNDYNDDAGLSDQDLNEMDHYVIFTEDGMLLHVDSNRNGLVDDNERFNFQRP